MMLGRSIDRDAALQLWESSGPSGYMIVEANGGLNPQHTAICNAVAAAGISIIKFVLNA
ncbi:hypothetical protein CIPAW_05G224600 [Carya illinoinensis]|uniref:Uncharacterized protein n=1 Tax=Carya illinoinensis TaxID=32201 RepID=A0A8T1QLB4_CARIL|nr:hypothetical protein CIPAW_05G224600 [Carya illinoinensis]